MFNLYKGYDQEVIERERSGLFNDINNIGFVNYYSLIADYAANLFMQKPIMYINNDGDESTSSLIQEYVKYNKMAHKNSRDKTTASHVSICGVGYRYIEMDKKTIFKDSVLNPKSVFTIYGDDTDDVAMARVYITNEKDNSKSAQSLMADITQESGLSNFNMKKRYTVYTDDFIYSFLEGSEIVTTKPAMNWGMPIVEYKMNPYYIGSFERVTTLIKLLSILRSDGVNGVVQSVSGIMFFKNIGIPMPNADDTEEELEAKKKILEETREGIKNFGQMWADDSKEKVASIEYIGSELYNADIDVLYEGILKDIITITRTPNSVVNLGGSGNTGAAETASGMTQALENAANAEPYWFESARNQSIIEIGIANHKGKLKGLTAGDFDYAIQREILPDKTASSSAYSVYLSTGMRIADAAKLAGITADPEAFETRQLNWQQEQLDRENEEKKRSELNVEEITERGNESMVRGEVDGIED